MSHRRSVIPADLESIAQRVVTGYGGDTALLIGAIAAACAVTRQKGVIAERRRCAKVASDRAAICADACDKIKAGTLYAGVPHAFATENCARLEATHIAGLILGDTEAEAEIVPDAVCDAALAMIDNALDRREAMRRVLLAQRDHNLQLAREEISRVGDKIAEGVA